MLGWIIPEPLAMAPMRTGVSPNRTSMAMVLVLLSLVRMAWAAWSEPWSDRADAAAAMPSSTRSMGRGTPMIPVEATPKSSGARPVAWAAAWVMRRAFSLPSGANALALPLLTTTPCRWPPARCCWETEMGAAFTRLRVKTPAAVQGVRERIRARSFLPASFTPQATPAARNPLGAVTPPVMY